MQPTLQSLPRRPQQNERKLQRPGHAKYTKAGQQLSIHFVEGTRGDICTHDWAWLTCRRLVQLCRAVSTAWLAALSAGPVLASLRRLAGSGKASSLLRSAASDTTLCISLHAACQH